jgi:ATP-dependent helicase IRC3
VGVTATPHRSDAKKLGTVFQEEVFRYELRDAMRDGWLCPIRAYRVVTGTDLTRVRTRQGDFVIGDLSRAINHQERTAQAIRHWGEVAADRRTLVFCADVAHSHDTAEEFRRAGIRAEAIDGSMPMPQRHAILARLRAGLTQVVTNCAVLTEGFDLPELSAIVMLRPTQSSVLYAQQAGRGTRLAPGKEDLVLIDVVDNCRRNSLVTAPALLGLPDMDLEGNSLLEAADLVERMRGAAAALPTEDLTFTDLQTRLEQWDIFGDLALPNEMSRTQLAWTTVPYGAYLSAGEGREARLRTDALGTYHLDLRSPDGARSFRLQRSLAASVITADRMVLSTWPDAAPLIRRSSRWRQEPATDRQLDVLRRHRVRAHVLDQITKGDACLLIGHLVGKS